MIDRSPAGSTLELVVDARAIVGEGPVWDAGRGVLWWVDILGSVVNSYDPGTGESRAIGVGSQTGAVALRRDGTLLLAQEDRLAVLDPEKGSGPEELLRLPDASPAVRSNDGKCDAAGHLWLDRMAHDAAAGAGCLLRIDPDLSVTTELTNLTIPNGLGWSLDGRTMYFVDSIWCEIRAYSYDPSSGTMGEGRTLVSFPDDGTVPDGLTVDADGCLWVARWGAGCVVRVAPDGRIVDRVDLPVSQATSCTFGGDDLADLYITTAHEDFGPADFAREPLAGGLFRCRPGVSGLLPAEFGE